MLSEKTFSDSFTIFFCNKENNYINILLKTSCFTNLLCSRKWANPGMLSGLQKLPTPIHKAAADYKYNKQIFISYICTGTCNVN